MLNRNFFKFFITAIFIFAFYSETATADKKLRVAIFEDRRTTAVEEIKKTLEEQGFEAGVVKSGKNNDFREIYNYDVIFFGGGWSAFNWLPVQDRMHLVEFVEQRGGGAIFSMFRCGTAARSIIRPLFPEVADAYNKVNSRGMIVIEPEHPVMEGLPKEFLDPYWDHAVMRLGPQGRALAVNSADEVAIACGDAGLGRVVFIGPWIGLNIANQNPYPMPETDKKLLLNSVRWAGASKYRDRNDSTELSEKTQLKVLRREKTIDWTHDERGKAWHPGILTRARNAREQELDDLAFRLNRYLPIAEETGAAPEILRLQTEINKLTTELQANHAQAVRLKQLEISRMSLEELEAVPIMDQSYRGKPGRVELIEEWRERLLFPGKVKKLATKVSALETKLEPELEKLDASKFAAAREGDSRNIRNLTADLQSDNAVIRAAAALELARIGDSGAARYLLSALNDTDYDVRKNAIYGLSWMQSKDAVPPLAKLLETSDHTRTRRRAAQALGQIGNPRAIDILVKTAKTDTDFHTRHNAILSLGWIGDKKATTPLINIATTAMKHMADDDDEKAEKNTCPHRHTFACAIRALGCLGDEQALPFLNSIETPKLTIAVRSPSVDWAAEAIEMIKSGGLDKQSLAQPDVLRDKDHFYWMSGRYNALYGRYLIWRVQPRDSNIMLSYAAMGGGNGTIEFSTLDAWSNKHEDIDIDKHFERATKLGLKINTQIPNYPHYYNKALTEREIARVAKHPSFGGLWLEECVSLDAPTKAGGDEAFREYLRKKYTPEQLTELGIDNVDSVTMPAPDSPRIYEKDGARADKVIFTEYMEYAADKGVDDWREAQEWIAGRRKAAKFSFSMSSRYSKGGSTFISAYPRINLALDAAGPQSYGAHSSLNNFYLDMHVDGESRPAQGEFYAHQASTPGRVERGFASSFVYGQQFFNWWWSHIFKHSPESNLGALLYDHGRWEAAVRQFTKGKALSEYLAPRETKGAGLVTQLYSGRTTTLTYGDGLIDSFGGRGKIAVHSPGGYPLRYTQDQQALWESIVRSHLPVEMTWLETQNPEKLARWKVAILADAVSIANHEAEMIREWVRTGGTLIVTASSTLHDQWDRKQENYSLADVFGVNYVSTAGNPGLVYLDRDIKPETGISEIRMTAAEYFLHMEGAISAEYEKDAGHDVVEPTTAKVVGVWDDDGTPAVLENKFGEGNVIFIAARYPALSHLTRDWTVDPLYNEYWPGMRELLAACVRRGLTLTGTELPLEVENCPETVEVILKRQEQNNRWMAHLLNIDEKNGIIKDVIMTVKPQRSVKAVYYAYPERNEIEFEETDNGIKFSVRPFDVHEMVVVEWEGK